MEQFLPTTIKDSNNNIKKRKIYVSSAVQVQQLSSTALTTLEAEEDKNKLMPCNEEWDEEEIIDSPALLIQNRNNSTNPLLLASKLPQNEITLVSDPLR